jgi:hypothetical protein
VKKIDDQPEASSLRTDLSVEVRINEVPAVDEGGDASNGPRAVADPEWTISALVLFVVVLLAGTYVGLRLTRGWVPADDGILAQSALRVMQGQLPHRDFSEIYTGGLSFIHAAAFRMFGVSLLSLRICVFLFFLVWIPAVYYIARWFTGPVAAGGIALLAVAWSFPNYTAAMPSWYNLFFATFGAAALMRYVDARTRRWLFVAGVCGGVSILIKVIGAYYIAGALLFLVYLEQSDDERQAGKGTWAYRAFVGGSLIAFLATLIYVLHARLAAAEFYHFVLPSTSAVGLILLGDRSANAGARQRFAAFGRLLLPFAAGVLAPIAVFLAPYASSGSVGAFVSGVLSSTIARAAGLAVIRPAPVLQIVFVLPLLGLLAAAMYLKQFQGRTVGAAVGLLALAVVVRAPHSMAIFSAVWFSVVMLAPVVVMLGAFLVFGSPGKECGRAERQRITLLLSLAATCSLVQFPFAAPIYMCYSLPLTLLALVAVVCTFRKEAGTWVLASVVGLYLVFGAVSVVPLHLAELTHEVGHMDKLDLPRGGIETEGAPYFAQLAGFLHAHAPNGLMYAGNDCPELYFLSGLNNVTRDDGGAPAEEVLRALKTNDVRVVVINEAPFFPLARMNPAVRAEIERRFPQSLQAGIFHVYWRE